MATITTVLSNLIKAGIRSIKSKTWGSNTETADSVTSGCTDFNPPKDFKAVFMKTGNSSQPVCVGYLLKSAVDDLEEGEGIFYSTDGTNVFGNIIARKNGDLELNGTTDNIVRYSELQKAYNELNDKFNAHIQDYNAHVHPGVSSGGSSTGATPTQSEQSNGDITPSKVDNVKTN